MNSFCTHNQQHLEEEAIQSVEMEVIGVGALDIKFKSGDFFRDDFQVFFSLFTY